MMLVYLFDTSEIFSTDDSVYKRRVSRSNNYRYNSLKLFILHIK